DGVVVVLYGDWDAMQRPDEISGSGKILVLRPRRFEGVEYLRVIVGGVGLRALAADVERYVGVHLAGVLDRGYFAEHEAGCRINFAFNAGAVISLNALEIELDELLSGDLFSPNRTVHVGNCRFLEVEPRRRGGFRHKREVRCV